MMCLLRNSVIVMLLVVLLSPITAGSQQDSPDERVTIEAYYILEQFLFDLDNAEGVQPIVDRLELGDYSYYVRDGEKISTWNLVEHDIEIASLVTSDMHSFYLLFDLTWLCRELGISQGEMAIAIDELTRNYEFNEYYQNPQNRESETYFYHLKVGNVIMSQAITIDLNQSDPDNRITNEEWDIRKSVPDPDANGNAEQRQSRLGLINNVMKKLGIVALSYAYHTSAAAMDAYIRDRDKVKAFTGE